MPFVFKFGARPPHENAELASNQIYLAHKYYNTLIAIERKRREAWRAMTHALCPLLEKHEAEAKRIDEEIESRIESRIKSNTEARRKTPASSEQKAAIAALRAARREVWAAYKLERGKMKSDPEIAEKLKVVDADAIAQVKAARAECGVYWGTYLLIEEAVKDAKRDSKIPPAFKKFRGDGRIAVQLQGGLSMKDAMGGNDSRLRLFADGPILGNGSQRHIVWMRSGSNPDRSPIWVKARVTIHKARAALDGRIKWAWLYRRRVGTVYRWSLQIVMEENLPQRESRGDGIVAINAGWRLKPTGGVRVAYYVDNSGLSGDLVLPQHIQARYDMADNIESFRDIAFNKILECINAWSRGMSMPSALAELESACRDRASKNNKMEALYLSDARAYESWSATWHKSFVLPQWWIDATKTMASWRSQARIAALLHQWKDNRFAGDEMAFNAVSCWAARDRHLWTYAQGNRITAIRQREAIMLKFVSEIRSEYKTIILDTSDHAELRKHADPLDGELELPIARRNAPRAAPGLLSELLRKIGAIPSDMKEITMRCHACKELSEVKDRIPLIHTCKNCGRSWDQDENACRNMLQSFTSGGVVS